MKFLPKPFRLTAALLGIGAASLATAHAGAAGKFVYYMNYADTPSGTHYQMYVINADGTGNTRIVHPDSDDTYPTLSPDGTQIAYRSSYQGGIRLTNLSGTTLTTIPNTDDCTYPAWSADGKKIAALGVDADSNDAFVTINVDGSNRVTRSLGSLYNYGGVVGWSPDGTKLVFTEEIYTGSSSKHAVYIANADGSGTPTKITSDDNSEYTNPSWSPDGTKILVQKQGAANGFYFIDPTTAVETPVGSPVVAGDHPTWSPDGKQIAFESEADSSYGDIGIVNLDGSGLHTIHTIGQANFVQWSAAGGFVSGGGPTAGAPVITSTGLGPIFLGQHFDYTITTDGKVPIASYAADILPAGLSLNTGTGEIFGTVQAADVPQYTSITITVTSTAGVSASKDLPLTFSTAAPAAAFSVSLVKPTGSVNAVAGTFLKAKAKVDLTNAGTETVANLSFLIDGKIVTTLAAKPYKATLALDDSLTGTHQLTVQAVGSDNRVATSAPITVTVAALSVDLAGTATLSAKDNPDKGKTKIKGDYTLSNLGNEAAGPFVIKFFLSDDTNFDPSKDQDLGPVIAQYTGKASNSEIDIPGLPANTTLDSANSGGLLPPIKLTVPDAVISGLGLHGKYILAVIDPDNTVGEDASTRANNVVAVQIP